MNDPVTPFGIKELTRDDVLSDAAYLDECAMRIMASTFGNDSESEDARKSYDGAYAMLAERKRRMEGK